MIRVIEEISLNAWPSFHSLVYDGWVIRFAGGYTRRANSINPLYSSTIDADEKIHWCEDLYHEQGLPVVFKITPEVFPNDLDERLAALGYEKDAVTSVQVLELQGLNLRLSEEVAFQAHLSSEWLKEFSRMTSMEGKTQEPHRKILETILPRKCFAALHTPEGAAACGLGVLQSGFVGLYDIITDPLCRGKGFGQKIVESLLAWGQQNGAQKAYLQVMLNNPTAMRLYARVGFEEKYQYWYRVKRWN